MAEEILKRLKEEYKNDRFATDAGCVITKATEDEVVCQMPLCKKHLNAHGGVMGGAIFTLADFAFAVASNLKGIPTVGIECNIRYYSVPKGKTLIATAKTDKEGRTLGHYTVSITDDTGENIAGYTAIAYHKNK